MLAAKRLEDLLLETTWPTTEARMAAISNGLTKLETEATSSQT
jgi:hypothetical protein